MLKQFLYHTDTYRRISNLSYEPLHPDEIRSYSYVAYIDEAGDDGLTKVKPIDPDGASEWLVLSAVIVSAENEHQVPLWHKGLRENIDLRQSKLIHFNRISGDWRKIRLCENLAELPIRCFAVVSNKQNMRGHTNPRAAKVPARNYFYCWMCRLLLERVTRWCAHRNQASSFTNGNVKLVFSERGGMSYSQFAAYLQWLRLQSAGNALYLKNGDLDWSVVSTDLLEAHNHTTKAGLQLADIVASAFYQAVSLRADGSCRPAYAEQLRPRMAVENSSVAGFGLKMMPTQLWKARLSEDQKQIFAFYGYEDRLLRR